MRLKILLIAFVLFCTSALRAQDTLSTDETFRLPMDKLYITAKEAELNKIEIAAKKAQTIEEAPSIVSLITRRDIDRYGARDLTDVLRMIPGFEFGVDVDAIFSIGFRGTWAHEGKALLMINGISINDYAYGNLNLFGNLSASLIERVEIIRGPGSVLYGGFAEVAVINVITAKGSEIGGARLSADGSVVGDGAFSRNVALSLGTRNKDFEIGAHLALGTNVSSTRTYHTFIDTIPPDELIIPSPDPVVIPSTKLSEANSARKPFQVVLNAKWKNFRFNFVRNSFTFLAQQHWFIHPQVNGIYSEVNNNTITGAQLRHTRKFSEKLSLETLLEYGTANEIASSVNPQLNKATWHNPGVRFWRYKAEANLVYNHWSFGGGYQTDNVYASHSDGRPGLQTSPDPGDTTRFAFTYSRYAFVQYNNQFRNWGLTAGFRIENTTFGNAMLPRIGVVYHQNKLNLKLLYGNSFRIPMPFQTYTRAWPHPAEGLKPELASTLEVEAGYRFSQYFKAKANLFFIQIVDPILFGANAYENVGTIQSAGVEGELNVNYEKFGGFGNFSFARPVGKATSEEFMSMEQKSFIGLPPMKFNAGAYYQWRKFNFAPSLTLLSERRGISEQYVMDLIYKEEAELHTTRYPALLLLNFNILATNLLKNVDVRLTGFNLLGANYTLLQPYYGLHAPMPMNDRQVMLKVSVKL